MESLSQDEKQKIIEKLGEKGVKSICPMCGNNQFIIADAYFSNTLQKDLKNLSLGGTSVPTIATICTNCGFVSQHALGILKLLPEQKNDQ